MTCPLIKVVCWKCLLKHVLSKFKLIINSDSQSFHRVLTFNDFFLSTKENIFGMFQDKKTAFICIELEVIVGKSFYESINSVSWESKSSQIQIQSSTIDYSAFLNKIKDIIYIYVE